MSIAGFQRAAAGPGREEHRGTTVGGVPAGRSASAEAGTNARPPEAVIGGPATTGRATGISIAGLQRAAAGPGREERARTTVGGVPAGRVASAEAGTSARAPASVIGGPAAGRATGISIARVSRPSPGPICWLRGRAGTGAARRRGF